jgi:hypothetical protein
MKERLVNGKRAIVAHDESAEVAELGARGVPQRRCRWRLRETRAPKVSCTVQNSTAAFNEQMSRPAAQES